METEKHPENRSFPEPFDVKMVEAVLYLENEPVDVQKLARITQLTSKQVRECLEFLTDYYEESQTHGIRLIEYGGGFHFVPKDELWEYLKDHYGKRIDRRLSKAALETLSIIAYSQPITRKEIDNIRGVSSDNSLRLLLEHEYVRAVGKKDVIGHPYLYGTTKKFLQEFNLKSISSLPKLKDLDYERFEEE